MADVQLEHGYLRIANRLYEALLVQDFTPRQFKILHGLIRLTYGWSRRTVTITQSDLAGAVGMTNTGSFRSELRGLVVEGVILVVSEGKDVGTPNTYALQKNFTKWGRWATHPDLLARRFGVRPDHADDLLVRPAKAPENDGDLGGNEPEIKAPTPARTQATLSNEGEGTPACTRDTGSPAPGIPGSLHPGEGTGSNSNENADLEGRKDIERQEIQRTTATATRAQTPDEVDAAAISGFAVGLVTAGNLAAKERWPESASMNPFYYGDATELASEVFHAKIPLEVARSAIAAAIKRSKLTKRPSTIAYFRNSIFDASKTAEQRRLDQAATKPEERGGDPTPLTRTDAHRVYRPTDRTEHQLGVEYDAARKSAVTSWAKANPTKYAAIVQAATEEWRDFLDTKTGQRSRDATIARKCGESAGFPSFERWKSNHADSSQTGASPPSQQKIS